MIVAAAGRRIDAPDAAEPRFPLSAVPRVRSAVRRLLEAGATTLVCSAACGADLVALTEAEALGLRRRIVLPFEAKRFRLSSVIDRPGHWGEPYDRVIAAAERAGDLVLAPSGDAQPDDERYLLANRVILDEALALTGGATARALLIWDGVARGPGDVTAHFGASARALGLELCEVRTR